MSSINMFIIIGLFSIVLLVSGVIVALVDIAGERKDILIALGLIDAMILSIGIFAIYSRKGFTQEGSSEVDPEATLTCWHCDKETQANKKICRHCHRELQ